MSVQIDGSTGNIIAIKADYSGDVSIGGTLTYEDVTNIDAVGLITARSGVKFGASGTTVVGNSSGIGVGTDNPGSNKLQVQGSSALYGNGGVSAVWGDTSYLGALSFDGSAQPVIRTASSKALIFQVNQSTEALRITSAGDMGLGTASPTSFGPTLQVAGTDPALLLQDTATAVDYFGVNVTSGITQLWYDDAAALTINTATGIAGSGLSEKLRITSAGRMGLGCTPDTTADFHIRNSNAANLKLGGSGSDATGFSFNYSNSGNTTTTIKQHYRATSASALLHIDTGTFTLATGTSNAEALRVDSSGRLLIAATSIDAHSDADDLQIGAATDSGERGITVASSAAGSIRFADDGNDTAGYIFYDHSDNSLRFGANGSEAARFDSSKRLLLGTTSSRSPGGIAASLQVEGTGAVDSSVTLVRNSNDINPSYLILGKSRGTSNGSNTIVAGGDNIGSIQWAAADGADIGSTAAYITCSVDGSTGTNDMPGRLVIGTTPDGSNSPTERLRIDSAGVVQIKQSSTANIFRIQNTTSNESSMLIQNSTTGYNAGNGLYIGIGGDETSYFWAYQNENMTFATNNTARMTIFAGGKIRAAGVYSGTTTGGSAVYVESDGDLLRYTSSLKYKTDVETIEDAKADAILNCRPVWYRSKCANDIKTEGSEKSDWGWYGFIAEEVAEIEPRLVNWATKDAVRQEDGSVESVERDPANYEAEGVRYDNFVPLLVNLAKRQQSTIESLEARIAALEG